MRRRTFGKWSTGRARRAAGTHRDASLALRAPHDTRSTTHASLIPRLRLPLYRSVLYTDVFCTRRELREMFDHMDMDGSGDIEVDEVERAVEFFEVLLRADAIGR